MKITDDQRAREKELQAQVKEMAKEWGLFEHSTYRQQMDLLAEETTEAMTEIGDIMVVATNAMNLATNHDDVARAHFEYSKAVSAAMALGVNPVSCLDMAVIKNNGRVGMIVEETGKYTKWKNLNHPQRIELAKSGKLNREGVDLDALLKFCSAKEAVEILDIMDTP